MKRYTTMDITRARLGGMAIGFVVGLGVAAGFFL